MFELDAEAFWAHTMLDCLIGQERGVYLAKGRTIVRAVEAMMSSISNELQELRELRGLSQILGSDPLLVQASSGNTSIKIADTLWIKASGKWLVHSDTSDFLVPVKLTRARKCLREDLPVPETDGVIPGRPRASIETAMHAILPARAVVHVHSVNAIAWSVRRDGPKHLAERLCGLNWQWIPYAPSGAPLAKSIERVLVESPGTDVLILANHGLVVCGEDCPSAEHLLDEVERRLAAPRRPAPAPHRSLLEHPRAGSSWCLPRNPAVHALATDSVSRRILSGGVLYPCQALFLPGTLPPPKVHLVNHEHYSQRTPLIIDRKGVLCSSQMTEAEEQMLVGLAEVVLRLERNAQLRYLTAAELSDVFSESSESYRRYASR